MDCDIGQPGEVRVIRTLDLEGVAGDLPDLNGIDQTEIHYVDGDLRVAAGAQRGNHIFFRQRHHLVS